MSLNKNIRDMQPGDNVVIGNMNIYKNKINVFSIWCNGKTIRSGLYIKDVFEYFGLKYVDEPTQRELSNPNYYMQRCGKCKNYFSGPIIYREKKEQHYMGRVKYWCPVCKSWWIEKNDSWEILQGFERYQVISAIRDVPGSTQAELLKYLNKNMCGNWDNSKQSTLSRILNDLEQRNRIFSDEYAEYWFNK